MKMERVFVVLGALSGLLAVAAGAFGAHALRGKLSPDLLSIFETGARYQMYHALALIAVAWASTHWPAPALSLAGWCFITGIVLFSGSLYFLALAENRWVGAITPIGGLAFLLGWLAFAWGVWNQRGPNA
jgi:uncharacterized membrane protein YgdD (TMEM256/DUF423 family)